MSSCGFWLGSETLGSIRLKIVNNCAQFAHARGRNACKSGEKFRSTLHIQWSSKQAGEMRLQSKLDSFCRNLRRGARRPPGCFGRIRGVEFFSRDNRTRRHSQPLRVKLAGQKKIWTEIFASLVLARSSLKESKSLISKGARPKGRKYRAQ